MFAASSVGSWNFGIFSELDSYNSLLLRNWPNGVGVNRFANSTCGHFFALPHFATLGLLCLSPIVVAFIVGAMRTHSEVLLILLAKLNVMDELLLNLCAATGQRIGRPGWSRRYSSSV